LVSIDFFVVPTITFQLLFTFVILSHDRRRLVHFAVTANPTAEWTARQLLQAFPWDHAPRYLLRDGDRAYGLEFSEMAKCMGIHEVLTAPQSPWQNAHLGDSSSWRPASPLHAQSCLIEAGFQRLAGECRTSRMLVCHAKSSFLCRTPAARHLTLDATGMVYGSLRLIVGQLSFW
jgi:hypothetical protein